MPRRADPHDSPDREEAPDAIARFLAARSREGWMPGAAWWVARAGEPVSRGAVGQRALWPRSEPATEATVYDLASLTKPLATALMLVMMEQEGRLDLDSPVGLYLEELAGSPVASASLLALACHASGLPAWAPLYLRASSLGGYLEQIAQLPLVHGTAPLYSDLGYIVLGAVLERVGGEDLDVAFRTRVAAPLALSRTGFARTGAEFADAAPTERGNAFERSLAGDPGASFAWRVEIPRGQVHDMNCHGVGGVAGHAGLFGSAGEVARILGELLRPQRLVLGRKALGRLLVPKHQGSRSVGFVMAGDASSARGVLADEAPGHTGFTGTSLWLDPPRSVLYVLLTNRVHPRVSGREFRLVRRGFHRIATRCARGAGCAAHG